MKQAEQVRSLLGLEAVRRTLTGSPAEAQLELLFARSLDRLASHGRFDDWWAAIEGIAPPEQREQELQVACPRVSSSVQHPDLGPHLRQLGPWKKGPFSLLGTKIDSEWRSDWKWERAKKCMSPLAGRRVLDVGTGNGYFLLRAVGEGASFILGLEPSVLFACQFMALARLFEIDQMALLPLRGEEFPLDCAAFDTVLSMGVLYHRRSPLDHLKELKGFLRPGGELVVESLVVPGPEGYSLMPAERYAKMRNVWFIPSPETVATWLKRLGFSDIVIGDTVATSVQEQRATQWSGPVSLRDFLDPLDPSRTIEGYPAPARAIITARRPV